MPKKMFFNISDEKRKRFIDAAMIEFTSKSFEQVSVNTIIKKADISRGSFYTYFDDLESLFNYLFRSVKEERVKYAQKILKEDSDIFSFVRKVFMHDFDAYRNENKYSLFRNYIHYVQTVKKGSIKDYVVLKVFRELEENDVQIDTFIKRSNIEIDKQELMDLFEVIVLIMINTLIKAENEQLPKEKVFELFFKRLDYIEHGVRKEKRQ